MNIGYVLGGNGTYNLAGGVLNSPNAYVTLGAGGATTGNFNVSGGTANIRGLGFNTSGSATSNVNLTGGRINLGAYGMATVSGGTTNINLGGGIMGTSAIWSSSRNITLTGTNGNVTFNTLDSVDGTTGRNITLSGVLSSTGSGGLIKDGAGTLTLSGTNTYTGTTTIKGGMLEIANGGSIATGSGITIEGGGGSVEAGYPFNGAIRQGALYLRDDSGSPGSDQIGSQTVTMKNGTILWYSGGGADTTTIQNVNLSSGFNTIAVAPNSSPDVLKITNLTRVSGATVEFRAAYATLGTGEAQIRIDNINGSAIANTNGILGGWAFVAGNSGTAVNFAKWDPAATIGSAVGSILAATPDQQTSSTNISAGLATENWLFNGNAGNSTVYSNQTINSAIVQSDVDIQNGVTLTLASGGLIFRTNKFWLKGPGSLTSGTNDLYLQSGGGSDQKIQAKIVDGAAGAVTLHKSGSGTARLENTNTYTGGTIINDGALELVGGATSGAGTIRGTATVNTGGTLQLSTGDATGYNTDATRLSVINLNGGTLRVNTISNQTLGSAIINMTGGSITGIAGSNLDFYGNDSKLNTLASTATSTINLPTINLRQNDTYFNVADGAAATDLLISSNIGNGPQGNHNMVKNGAGTMKLTGINSFSGSVTINGGMLEVGVGTGGGNASAIGNGGNTIVVNSGGTLWFSTGSRTSGYHTGAANINGGTITFDTPDNSFASGKSLTFDGAVGKINGSGQWRMRDIGAKVVVTAAASGSMISVSNLTLTTNNQIFEFNVADGTAANDLAISSLIGGHFGGEGLNKTGAGTMVLSGTNTFTGNVAVNGGILKLSNGGALGTANTAVTKTTVASGATLDINGTADTRYGITIAGTGTAGQGALVNMGSSTTGTQIQTPNIALSADASFGGTGDFFMIASSHGANTLTLNDHTLTKTGSNTFSLDNTTVTSGTIQIAQGSISQNFAASDASAAKIALSDVAGTSLKLNNLNLAVGSLAGGGTTGGNVELGSATLTVGALNADTSYAGAVSGTGTGSLTKNGTGSQTLTGDSSYKGATAVNAGKLVINGDNSAATGAVTVAANATLGGIGTVGGATTIQGGGIHGPGNSPGVQKFTSDLTYADASIFSWEIDRSLTQNRGVGYDAVNVAGTLAGLDGGDAGTTTDAFFRIVIGDSDFTDAFWNTSKTWADIFTGSDGSTAKTDWTAIFGGGFQYYKTDGTELAAAPTTGNFTMTGNSLTWTAVPEPTSALAGLLLAAGLFRRNRRAGSAVAHG